ncbi:hypothetical protein DAPPPG734_23050 (plasmid) [Pantoea agglomerans]|uniref:N-ethylmaleimide reductase n=1 Tax=Enterobacter agglomerans TaxID=549 RepID=A0AAN2K709_ENTAG|nr:hypothetical protein DAPPPG734_23050 [Pantoea agglomerans]
MTDNSTRTDLFSPVSMGSLQLSNRIVMAPVTRSRYGEVCLMNSMLPTMHSVPGLA